MEKEAAVMKKVPKLETFSASKEKTDNDGRIFKIFGSTFPDLLRRQLIFIPALVYIFITYLDMYLVYTRTYILNM